MAELGLETDVGYRFLAQLKTQIEVSKRKYEYYLYMYF